MQFYTSRRLARSSGLEGDDATGTDNSGWLYSFTGAHLLKTTTGEFELGILRSERSVAERDGYTAVQLTGSRRIVSVGEPCTLLAAGRSRTIRLAGYTALQLVAACSAPAIRFGIAYLARSHG